MAKRKQAPTLVLRAIESEDGGRPKPDFDEENMLAQFDRFFAAFGTKSGPFVGTELSGLMNALSPKGGLPSEDEINAALATIAAVKPKNEVEALLAVQIVITHAVSVALISNIRQYTSTKEIEARGTLATKFQRTFLAQLETLTKMRRGGKQTVKVIHVHQGPGAQAIIGDVDARRVEGVSRSAIENGNQTHASHERGAIDVATSDALWSPDEGRSTLPIPAGDREKALSDARRRSRNRSTSR